MISLALYSFRTAPGRTAADLAGLALWSLSVRHARRHFPRVVLATDRAGAVMLGPEGMNLPFTSIEVCLDDCEPAFPHVWALGKLWAYREWAHRGEPFIHLDHDVILWRALPERILAAPVCALMPESLAPGHWRRYCYSPAFVRSLVVPPCVGGMIERADDHAFNAAIFGGTDLGFIRAYVAEAFASLHHPANAARWAAVDGTTASVFLEQYWLAAVAWWAGRRVETLVTEAEHDDPAEVAYRRLGFTHVWGESKRQPPYRDLVLLRCRQEFPADLARARAMLSTTP